MPDLPPSIAPIIKARKDAIIDAELELMKPRRVASVQLLGTIEHAVEATVFDQGR